MFFRGYHHLTTGHDTHVESRVCHELLIFLSRLVCQRFFEAKTTHRPDQVHQSNPRSQGLATETIKATNELKVLSGGGSVQRSEHELADSTGYRASRSPWALKVCSRLLECFSGPKPISPKEVSVPSVPDILRRLAPLSIQSQPPKCASTISCFNP